MFVQFVRIFVILYPSFSSSNLAPLYYFIVFTYVDHQVNSFIYTRTLTTCVGIIAQRGGEILHNISTWSLTLLLYWQLASFQQDQTNLNRQLQMSVTIKHICLHFQLKFTLENIAGIEARVGGLVDLVRRSHLFQIIHYISTFPLYRKQKK